MTGTIKIILTFLNCRAQQIKRMFIHSARLCYLLLISPKEQSEDKKRQEFILNIILIGFSIVLSCLTILTIYKKLLLQNHYQGISAWLMVSITLAFTLLLIISRIGYFRFSAYFIISLYYIGSTYGMYHWGVDLPQAILSYALIISITTIVIGTRAGISITVLLTSTLLFISYHQAHLNIIPKTYWRTLTPELDDAIGEAIIFSLIMLLSWLSGKEIEKSLSRARQSEHALKLERDQLEVTVQKRTDALKKVQLEKMAQLYRFAKFGKLASGMFHDLVGPLNAIALTFQQIDRAPENNILGTQLMIKEALSAAKHAERFIDTMKKQIQNQDVCCLFFVSEEINNVLELLHHKILKASVTVKLIAASDLNMHGNPIKFSQILANIISNAIDAYDDYENIKTKYKVIKIRAKKLLDTVTIDVEDFGKEIPANIAPFLFEPFFTTKSPDKGIGLGLASSKEHIEKEFNGTIKFRSDKEHTIFTATFKDKDTSQSA